MVKHENSAETFSIKSDTIATDEELIARFQKGDEYAFDQIVRRYKDPLLNFVYRFVGDTIEAEDIVQDTFYRVYKNKHYYKEVAKFSTWIYTIAGNLSKTELRRRRRRKFFSIHSDSTPEKEYELPDNSKNPETKANSSVAGEETGLVAPAYRSLLSSCWRPPWPWLPLRLVIGNCSWSMSVG